MVLIILSVTGIENIDPHEQLRKQRHPKFMDVPPLAATSSPYEMSHSGFIFPWFFQSIAWMHESELPHHHLLHLHEAMRTWQPRIRPFEQISRWARSYVLHLMILRMTCYLIMLLWLGIMDRTCREALRTSSCRREGTSRMSYQVGGPVQLKLKST